MPWTKGSPTFVMTVLGHDTAFTTRRDDFIFSFQNSIYFSTTSSGSLSAITPLQLYSSHFIVLSLNSSISKSSPAFMACLRTWLQPKKMYFTREFSWLARAEQPLLFIFFALAKGDNSSSKPRSHLSPAPSFWEATGEAREEGKGYVTYWKIPFHPLQGFSSLAQFTWQNGSQPGPVGINHKTLVSDQLRFSLTCRPTFTVGLQFL